MRIINFKKLTLILASFLAQGLFAQVLKPEVNATHFRLNIFTQRNNLEVVKKGEIIQLKSLNAQFFELLKKDLEAASLDKTYIKSVRSFIEAQNKVPTIELTLSHPRVELFSFYRDREERHVLDFWLDRDEKADVVGESTPPQKIEVLKTPPPPSQAVKNDKITRQDARSEPAPVAAAKKTPAPPSPHRDFRYGAAFIWDYQPLAPRLKGPIDIKRKTAEYFYPIVDRDIEKSEEEAHLQLSINMFRDQKWGLMAKSIQLFEQKYPNSKLAIMNEYLKANTLLRENFAKGQSTPVKSAITMYENLIQKTPDYELRKALYKYLMTYFHERNEDLRTLNLAKKFYVDSRENFDYEESALAVDLILVSLAKLNHIDKIQEVTEDKTLQKIVPAQTILAYKLFALLGLGKVEDVLKMYEAEERGLSKPIDATILYNVAEAYFRTANYEKAIKLYDDFVANYSHMTSSSHARLRIALAYDLLDRDYAQTLELYRNAINRSQDHEISYEARIRFTAMKSVRPRLITDADREMRVFLERDRRSQGEISKSLRELLWLTRLRTFIVDEKYQEALSYLNAVPLTSLTAAKRRVFEGDGAEIVFGLISTFFKNAEYSKVIQTWEVYRDQYINKVAEDPFINFVIGKSYIKLGLYDGFEQVYQRFARLESTPERTFPLWVKRENMGNRKELLAELQVIRNLNLKNLAAARKELSELRSLNTQNNKLNYYEGLIAYREQNYQGAAKALEEFLARQKERVSYDPDEVAEMILAYTESIYRLNDDRRFRRVAKAILNDTRDFAPEHKYMKEVREKLAYLLIENYAKEATDEAYLTLTPMIEEFLKSYPKSSYLGRMNLLLGMAYVRNKDEEKGRKLLEDIVANEGMSAVVRDLAKSELSLLRIKDITL